MGKFAALVCLACICIPAIAHADGLQDAQQKFDAGQFPEAIKLISPELAKTKPTDEGGDRYPLLMLRAECLLRMNQRISAANNFELAVKCAPDLRAAAIARANSLLVKASPNNKYTPKQGKSEAIDILDPESRKRAFDALREDTFKTLKPKYEAAMNGNQLPPMFNVLPALLDVGYLEFASKGSAADTREDLQNMGRHARELMNSEIRRISHQINALDIASNTTEDYTRRGLFSNERKMVQDNIEYLKKIEQTARDARHRAQELGFDGRVWEPVIADAGDLADRAQAMLDIGN
jgi:hypothetical protein